MSRYGLIISHQRGLSTEKYLIDKAQPFISKTTPKRSCHQLLKQLFKNLRFFLHNYVFQVLASFLISNEFKS